jgi:Peptidase_C39 like family
LPISYPAVEARLGALAAGITFVAGLCGGSASHPPAPKAAVVVEAGSSPSPSTAPSEQPRPLPQSVFIKVPYTSQAPRADWPTHEDYCEPAALLMYADFLHGDKRQVIPADEADREMTTIIRWERLTFASPHPDLTLEQMGQTAEHFHGFGHFVQPADLGAVKQQLAAGHPVIIPVMTHGAPGGQPLSPHYGRQNVYHVILITGYDGDRVYTNDAGFMQGQNQSYAWSTLESAMDAQQAKMHQGRVMLVLTG